MPLIMDDPGYNMDVDDLFGDAEPVALPTIAAPAVKGLANRLDELSANGCCQKIAWSKSGCVAYISADGSSVYLRVFSRDPKTTKWDLGHDIMLEIPPEQDSAPYIHVSFSHMGNDLAVMNATGHVLIFSCYQMTLGRMASAKYDFSQHDTDIDAVVGLHWLAIYPHEQKNHIAWSATGRDTKWSFHTSSHMFQDAHHPIEGKASMLYLKRHGDLRLRYQHVENSWQEATISLEPRLSAGESFTHAAFASNNDNTMLLAAYDSAGQMHHYQIEPKWTVTPASKQGQPQRVEKLELVVTPLGIEDDCFPVGTAAVKDDSAEAKLKIPAQLTHLNFLPRTPEQNDDTVPTVQAIFATSPNTLSFDQSQAPQYSSSILVRWEVHPMQRYRLNPSLEKVTSKRKSVGSIPVKEALVLRRLPDIVLHSVVVAFYPIWYNMLLAFCYSDGTIDFRKRSTMDQIMADYNTESVTSLIQAGFSFPTLDQSLHVALSPNHCIAACMQHDGTIKLRSAEYSYGSLASSESDPKHIAALVALVLQSSSAGNQYFSSDDLFSVMGALSPARESQFIDLMFQGLNVNIDCGVDENSNTHLMLLGRSPLNVKVLSAAHLLGLEGAIQRSVSSKVAWMTLNIKYITNFITTLAKMHGNLEKNPLRPEMVPYFVGIVRWIMHFQAYLIDELFAIGFTLQQNLDASNNPIAPTLASLNQAIHDESKPGLLILLSSFPRTMMRMWPQVLTWVARTASSTSSTTSLEMRRAYAPLHQVLTDLPLDWRLFEPLMLEAQTLVRDAYRKAGLDERGRNEVERQIILGHVPEVLWPAARHLVTETLFGPPTSPTNNSQPSQGQHKPLNLIEKLDLSRILFFDTTWLGLSTSKKATKWWDAHMVDVCLKTIIRGPQMPHPASLPLALAQQGQNGTAASGAGSRDRSASLTSDSAPETKKKRLKQCVRCGAEMEDVGSGAGYGSPQINWLMNVAKHCVCGNHWMVGGR